MKYPDKRESALTFRLFSRASASCTEERLEAPRPKRLPFVDIAGMWVVKSFHWEKGKKSCLVSGTLLSSQTEAIYPSRKERKLSCSKDPGKVAWLMEDW